MVFIWGHTHKKIWRCQSVKQDWRLQWANLNQSRLVDLRTAQIYWDAIFFGQPGSVSKFSPFLWVKLWVGWVGRGYIEISRYFPALWINRVTLVTKTKLWYSLGYQITFESPKCLYGMLFCVSKPDSFFFSIPFLPQQPCKVFSHWLLI